MSFAPGAFAGNVQQQLAQLAQQQQLQQRQLQAQQLLQAQQNAQAQAQPQQPSLSSYPKAQQDFLNSLTPQQLQALLNQKNSVMQMQSTPFPQMPQAQMPSVRPVATAATPAAPPAQPSNMSAVLSDMLAKAKAGLLTPLQLAQLRAVLEQQQQAQSQRLPNALPNQTFAQLQAAQAKLPTPMVVPTGSTSPRPSQSDKRVDTGHLAQGVQFVRTVQQRIQDIEQKLATGVTEVERQGLQRSLQELMQVQGVLLQKLAQGAQFQQPRPPASPRMTPNFTNSPKGNVPLNNANMSPQPQAFASSSQAPAVTMSHEHFKRALTDLMHRHGKQFHSNPRLDGREVDLYRLFTVVSSLGGGKAVTQKGAWSSVVVSTGFAPATAPQLPAIAVQFAQIYRTYLELFEEVWNRALIHQMSMTKPAMNSTVPVVSRPAQTPMSPVTASPQFGNLNYNSANSPHMAQQARPAQAPQRPTLPFSQEQLAALNIKPEQLSQLLQQQNAQKLLNVVQNPSAQQSHAQRTPQPWPPSQPQPQPQPPQLLAQAQAKAANERSNAQPSKSTSASPEQVNTSPEKKLQTTKVTPKKLDDAEKIIQRLDSSLKNSRPRLPVLSTLSEAEKTKVFEQVEQMTPLKFTVSALLPVFLAMTGNIEPAKRVKIMIYMFDDQLALLPQRQCILRMTDLEKLRVQMIRCIGFVRLNDDKLAQNVIQKAVTTSKSKSRSKETQPDARANTRGGPPRGGPPKKTRGRPPSLDLEDDVTITGANLKSESRPSTPQMATPTKGSFAEHLARLQDFPGTPQVGSPQLSEHVVHNRMSDFINQAVEKAAAEHTRNQELAEFSPVEFAIKAWSECSTGPSKPSGTVEKSTASLAPTIPACESDRFDSILFALMRAPFDVSGSCHEMGSVGTKDTSVLTSPLENILDTNISSATLTAHDKNILSDPSYTTQDTAFIQGNSNDSIVTSSHEQEWWSAPFFAAA